MSFAAKRELLTQVAPRYREAGHPEKTTILDQFVAATGYARKYAIRLLQQPIPLVSKEIRRPREHRYGKEVQEALAIAWSAANCNGNQHSLGRPLSIVTANLAGNFAFLLPLSLLVIEET